MAVDALREVAGTVSEDAGMGDSDRKVNMGELHFWEVGRSFEGGVLRMEPTGEKVEEQGWQRRPQLWCNSS